MAYGNTVSITGNLTRDPELKFLPSGVALTELSIAHSTKNKDGKESVSYFDVTMWRKLGENVSDSLKKGTAVIVHGSLKQDSWEDKDSGQRRSKVYILAEDVAPSLKWATADVTKNDYNGPGANTAPTAEAAPAAAPAAPAIVATDENPFDI